MGETPATLATSLIVTTLAMIFFLNRPCVIGTVIGTDNGNIILAESDYQVNIQFSAVSNSQPAGWKRNRLMRGIAGFFTSVFHLFYTEYCLLGSHAFPVEERPI
jgi:hypothetical protein